jgi:hypothetical protein
MPNRRITVTLPPKVAADLRDEARRKHTTLGRIVTEGLIERRRIHAKMIEGYIATREESRLVAEEWFPIAAETWPTD